MTQHTQEQTPRKKKGLFADLSMTQVIAGALAAVTSMLLASQIGIAGSVIGVGVGSIVSAVASQMYKNFLSSSAKKLRDLSPADTSSDTDSLELGEDKPADATVPLTSPSEKASHEQATARMSAAHSVTRRRSNTPHIDDAALQGDATVMRAKDLRENKKKVQRRVLVVSVISALVAVAVSALLINAATSGQGIGTKTYPLMTPQTQTQEPNDTSDSESFSETSAPDTGSSQSKSSTSADDTKKNSNSASSKESASGSTDKGTSDTSTDTSQKEQGQSSSGSSGSKDKDNSDEKSDANSDSGSDSDSESSSDANTGSTQKPK